MNIFLGIHIIGATLSTLVMVSSAMASLFRIGSPKTIRTALKIAVILPILSGVALLFFVPGSSVSSVCYMSVGYIAATVVLQFFVRWRFGKI